MDRSWSRGRGTKQVIAIVFAAALVAGLTTQATPVTAADAQVSATVDDEEVPFEEDMGLPGNWEVREEYTADSPEVQGYARSVGIKPADALSVLEFQNEASEWIEEIEKTIGFERFAAAEFAKGRAELVIHVNEAAKSVDDALLALISDAKLSGTVRIEADAVYSLSERWELQNTSDTPINVNPLTGETKPYEPVIEATTGCQTLYGRATDGGRLVRWDNSWPYDKVRSDSYNGYTDCEAIPSGNAIRCTNAFSVTKNGWQGYLPAAHCGNKNAQDVSIETSSHIWSEMYAYNMRYAYAQHRFYVAQQDDDADAQMNREVWGSTALNNRIYLDEENGFQSITSVQNGAPAWYSWLCVKNALPPSMGFLDWDLNDDTAGMWCGYVIDSYHPHGNGSHWAEIQVDWGYQNDDVYHTDGGSGGPVYSSSKAYGMITHSSGGYVGTTGGIDYYYHAIFMHADEIEDELGCSIYTG